MYKTISVLLLAALGAWVGGSEAVTKLSYPKIVSQVALTNQTNSIPATTILTSTKGGLYRISVYMVQVFPQTITCYPPEPCGDVYASFQWTDDGGTQMMNRTNGSIVSPLYLQLNHGNASGTQDPCGYTGNSCNPLLFPNSSDGSTPPGLPGAVFLVRANAKTPLIYSVTLENEVGDGMVYDYFMTMEQLE
jgi:hypothetical protein